MKKQLIALSIILLLSIPTGMFGMLRNTKLFKPVCGQLFARAYHRTTRFVYGLSDDEVDKRRKALGNLYLSLTQFESSIRKSIHKQVAEDILSLSADEIDDNKALQESIRNIGTFLGFIRHASIIYSN